jgi:hypothetical protein
VPSPSLRMPARRRYVGSGSGSSNAAPPRGRARSHSLVASRALPSAGASVPTWIVGKPNWCRVLNCAACQCSYSLRMFSFHFRRCAGSLVLPT